MVNEINTIGVVTPGGDAPGMNTAIRAVVRTAIFHGRRVMGIERGYAGLIGGDIHPMDLKSVSGIVNRGGTILHTVRCAEFKKKSFRKIAGRQMKDHGIDALVVIGGNGSLGGAHDLHMEFGINSMVVPASIDNDIPYTDSTIGYDTAVNTALDAIDKIRDTAASHERVFIIEVMGRDNGFIALEVGLGAGAEIILVPEVKCDFEKVAKRLQQGMDRGKLSTIIVVAEGACSGQDLKEYLAKKLHVDVRVTVLGHIQRGGSPSAESRSLACKLGSAAVELLLQGQRNKLVGMVNEIVTATDIAKAAKAKKTIDRSILELAEKLSI
jgi:6-phosphofructokinase 1